jgi:lysophospholipase L1-like esterase
MKILDFGAWSPRDFAANTLTGGGLNFSNTHLINIDGKTVFEMFDRKNTGHRTKFVDVLEDAAAGNKYRVSLKVMLGESCTADSAEVCVGVTDPFVLYPSFFCEPRKVTKGEWTTIEFEHTIKEDSHTSISVEQPNKATLAESILVSDISVELLYRAEKKEEADERKTLWLIGDSITCNYLETSVTKGWGMYIGDLLDKERIKVCNMARAGFSTQSFINTDGLALWSYVCRKMRKGDFLIVSLGINDFSSSLPERKTTREQYAENLCAFADEANRQGVSLLFVTSTVTVDKNPVKNYRRQFLEAMIEAAETKKAQGYDVSCIDLNAHMFEEIRKIEAEKGRDYLVKTFFSHNVKDGVTVSDTTHNSEIGAKWVASMITELVQKSNCPLKEYISGCKF